MAKTKKSKESTKSSEAEYVRKKAQEKKFQKVTKLQDKIIKIIAVILFLLAIILIIHRVIFGKNLSTDNKIVKELHNYLVPEDLNNCNGLVGYTDGEITKTSYS